MQETFFATLIMLQKQLSSSFSLFATIAGCYYENEREEKQLDSNDWQTCKMIGEDFWV